MPKENDLEGVQDQGGKHGGQKGMPKSEPRPACDKDQGIVRDERGQEQHATKSGRSKPAGRIRSSGELSCPGSALVLAADAPRYPIWPSATSKFGSSGYTCSR
jgi:hypothetical protein